MRTLSITTVILSLSVVGCQKQETPQQMQTRMDQEASSLQQAANALDRRWETWEAGGMADSFPTVYTEQGREMPPNMPAAVGREAIRDLHAQQASMGQFTSHIKSESVIANGPLGVEHGTYTFSFTPNKGMENMGLPPADTGKYVVHWQNVNGTWMIAALIYNSDLPIPMPPQKAPARSRP